MKRSKKLLGQRKQKCCGSIYKKTAVRLKTYLAVIHPFKQSSLFFFQLFCGRIDKQMLNVLARHNRKHRTTLNCALPKKCVAQSGTIITKVHKVLRNLMRLTQKRFLIRLSQRLRCCWFDFHPTEQQKHDHCQKR